MSAVPSTLSSPTGAVVAQPRWPLRTTLGLAMLGLLALFALLGPWLVGASPVVQDLRNTLAPPSAQHWLGTDVLGRSALARLAHAAQLSLGMALLAAVSAAVPGTLLGIAAAWRGGRTERALLMLSDSVLAIPGLLLVLLIAALAPGALWALYAGLSAALWVEYFRVSRAVARPVLAGDAVQAQVGVTRFSDRLEQNQSADFLRTLRHSGCTDTSGPALRAF